MSIPNHIITAPLNTPLPRPKTIFKKKLQIVLLLIHVVSIFDLI